MSESITDKVRAWAAGSHTTEAAAELLIRSGLIEEKSPWIFPEGPRRGRIDSCTLADEIGAHPWHQQVAAKVAANLIAGHEIDLADLLPGLDRKTLHLILAALAHAGGSHEHGHVIVAEVGPVVCGQLPPLVAWPQESAREQREVKSGSQVP